MIKKLWTIAGLLAVLVGCEDGDNGEATPLNQEAPPPTVVNIAEEDDAFSLEILPQIMWDYNYQGIILLDLVTNEILADFRAEAGNRVSSVYQLANGDVGVIVTPNLQGTFEFDGNIYMVLEDNTEIEATATFILFDQELNLIEEIEITDTSLMLNHWYSDISADEGQLKIYYPVNNRIYAYNLSTHTTEFIVEVELELSYLRLEVIANQIVFLAMDSNWDASYCGVIDLETKQVSFSQMDMLVEQLMVQGDYALLTERLAAFFGVPIRGEVVLFNIPTGESRLFTVAEYESTNAIVIADRYVLTGSTSYIRLYDIRTNELVLEQSPSIDLTVELGADGDPIDGRRPGIHTFLTVSEGLYAVVFNVGDGTFHVEFIAVEEL